MILKIGYKILGNDIIGRDIAKNLILKFLKSEIVGFPKLRLMTLHKS